MDLLGDIGQQYKFDDKRLPAFEDLVCRLYKALSKMVNEARYELFAVQHLTEHSLPPTSDCLLQHLRRVTYQSAIWRRSTQANNMAPSPHGYGWTVTAETVNLVWLTEPCAQLTF
jgi:hypothetical protein